MTEFGQVIKIESKARVLGRERKRERFKIIHEQGKRAKYDDTILSFSFYQLHIMGTII